MKLRPAIAAAAGLLVLAAGSAWGATHTVCASGCDTTTISAAVLLCSNGDTISVTGPTTEAGVTVGALSNITIAGTGNPLISFGGATQAFNIQGTTGLTISGLRLDNMVIGVYTNGTTTSATLSNITITNCSNQGIRLDSGATGTWSMTGLDITAANCAVGIWAGDAAITIGGTLRSTGTNTLYAATPFSGTITTSGLTIANSAGDGIRLEGTSGAVTIGTTTVTGAAWQGLRIDGASNVTVNDSVFSSSGGGIYLDNAWSTVAINRSTTNSNSEDGVSANGTGSGLIITRHTSNSNGSSGSNTSGDGYTAHSSCSGIEIYESIAIGNLNTAIGMVGTSSGKVYNFTALNNGSSTAFGGSPSARGGIYLALDSTSGAGWDIRNWMGQGNYPYEIWANAAGYADMTIANVCWLHTGNGVTESSFANVDTGTGITSRTYAQWEALGKQTSGYYATASLSSNGGTPLGHEAINHGSTVGNAVDLFGRTRIGAYDIGAIEYYPAANFQGGSMRGSMQ